MSHRRKKQAKHSREYYSKHPADFINEVLWDSCVEPPDNSPMLGGQKQETSGREPMLGGDRRQLPKRGDGEEVWRKLGWKFVGGYGMLNEHYLVRFEYSNSIDIQEEE